MKTALIIPAYKPARELLALLEDDAPADPSSET